jgi:hypothetical protein
MCVSKEGSRDSSSKRKRVHAYRRMPIRRLASLLTTIIVTESAALQIQSTNIDSLLSQSAIDAIQSTKIAVIPNFISTTEVVSLRNDAQMLWKENYFSTDALAAYGSNGKFDPSKDRAVLKLSQWKNPNLGNYQLRMRFGNRLQALRSELARGLDRPGLDKGSSTTLYGHGSTEVSYTRFGPGAFLKRHVDEHHEELKGTAGWTTPTRRSISWLIYINDSDWNAAMDGGQLRCFQRKHKVGGSCVGAMHNGDLQIGWLRATLADPVERPVYLDGSRHNHVDCALYIVEQNKVKYISKTFATHPTLYVAGSEEFTKRILMADRKELADRFHYIEPPKNRLSEVLKRDSSYLGSGEDAQKDEELRDVDPMGGTLVLFDSVSLPHEVLATKQKSRWATSGWFHEDQQAMMEG